VLLETAGADGVVFISGDRHFAELSMLEPPGLYPLYDLTSSALNIPHPSGRTGTNSHRLGSTYVRPNLGVLELDWEDPRRLTFQIRDQRGALRLERSVSLDALSLASAR
jgi:alkaline phosphatase D